MDTKYNMADGMGVVWASILLGDRIKERVTGTDFVKELVKFSAENGFRLFFYGGKPGVAEEAKANLEKEFPGAQIVGISDGYRRDYDGLIAEINACEPHFVMVCLGNPFQEEWISKYFNKLKTNVVFGNGGALDFHSGKVKRAPVFIQNMGFEWLFRLFQDLSASRIRRQFRLFYFIIMIGRLVFSQRVNQND